MVGRKSPKKKKPVFHELDSKVKEIKEKKKPVGEIVGEVEKKLDSIKKEEGIEDEEDLEQFVEGLWKERLKEEEREREDAFNPDGLVLESGLRQEDSLEESVGNEGGFVSNSAEENDMYGTGQQGEVLYGEGQKGESLYGGVEGTPMYNEGRGEENSNMYGTNQSNPDMYGVNQGSENKMYDENMGSREVGKGDSLGGLEGSGLGSSKKSERISGALYQARH